MTDQEILQQMRDQLRPQGTTDVVRVAGMFFNSGFINSCVNELSRLRLTAMLGEKPTPLQQLAYEVLKNAASIP